MDEVLRFLVDLRENNNKEWFNAHRENYLTSRTKVWILTAFLIDEIRKFDNEVTALDPEDCIFRIFRDMRFGNDKRPYKTNFGSYIARGGRKSTRAGYYFHIEPEVSFVGGGIYLPEANVLKALRTAIYDQPAAFRGIIENPEFKTFYPEIEGEKLKTAPKGFPADFEHIDLLRYKSYVFTSKISLEVMESGDFINKAIEAYRALQPVNRFLNEALDNYL